MPGAHEFDADAPTSEHTAEGTADALSIGRKIRHFRTEHGMTLEQLGERVGRPRHKYRRLNQASENPLLHF